jgi:hypothetical protein
VQASEGLDKSDESASAQHHCGNHQVSTRNIVFGTEYVNQESVHLGPVSGPTVSRDKLTDVVPGRVLYPLLYLVRAPPVVSLGELAVQCPEREGLDRRRTV